MIAVPLAVPLLPPTPSEPEAGYQPSVYPLRTIFFTPFPNLLIAFTVSSPSLSEGVPSNTHRPLVSYTVPCPPFYRLSSNIRVRVDGCRRVPSIVSKSEIWYWMSAQIAEAMGGKALGKVPSPFTGPSRLQPLLNPLFPPIPIAILHFLHHDSRSRWCYARYAHIATSRVLPANH